MLQPNDLVLFQGDSITHAHRMPAEVNDLFQLGAGYAAMAASQVRLDRPRDQISFVNRGVCGNTTHHLLDRWRPDALDLQPTVLSLLIGINDSNALATGDADHTHDHYRHRLYELLTMAREDQPELKLILLEPFLLTFDGIRHDQVEDIALRQDVVRDIAKTFDAVFVPLQQKMDDLAASAGHPGYACYDTIHPTAAGHRLIAEAWLDAVGHSAEGNSRDSFLSPPL